MDTHTQNDSNNPINYNEKPRYCEICDIQEDKTYFVDDECICQDCKEEEEKENIIGSFDKDGNLI